MMGADFGFFSNEFHKSGATEKLWKQTKPCSLLLPLYFPPAIELLAGPFQMT